ncbi:alpha/beta hydrolase [Marinomonas posidonica]|uniref:alpha/beta hydrolase n=1 Tax=Marinomonas posidonica TaxID=936476 RepID=UPI00373597DB
MWPKVLMFGFCCWLCPIWAAGSEVELEYRQSEPFQQYVERAKDYVRQHKVWVDESQQDRELQAVLPFELMPDDQECSGTEKIGILLSHGLSDSPFSMRDPAWALQQACYQVRVVLLAGHGTQSADLIPISRQTWRDSFRHAADAFQQEVDVLYVGGFSTGGALAIEYAWQHADSVAGVVLFSPLFKVNSSIDWVAPLLAPFKDWLDNYPSDDFAKYASIPVPAIAEVYKLAKEVRKYVSDNPKELPVFIALSAEDQTVDSEVTQAIFQKAMISPKSQMVLYSKDQRSTNTDRLKIYNTRWPESNILGLSHMAVHGSPENPYYGAHGEYRICGWYLSDPERYQTCRNDSDNWFGEGSDELTKKSLHAARVSWNPNFLSLMKEVAFFLQANAN